MTSLTRFESNDGIELVIDTITGEAFASQSGYARMSGKDRTTIVRRCQGCADRDIKTAEMLTPGGLQGCVLIPAKLVFKWMLKDNLELAEAMGTAGATLYIHQLAGFKKEIPIQEPIEPQIPLIQRQGLSALDSLYNGLDRAQKLGNQRLIQQFEVQISQYCDAYVSIKQLPPSNQTEQEQKHVETVVDVAIRLGKQIPSNLESSLGKFIKNHCGHLLLDEKDSRTSASSGKRLSVNCYPANNVEIENHVLAYCQIKGI